MSINDHERELLASVLQRPPSEWGGINSVRKIADGLVEVGCEGHGGVGVSLERNLLIPQSQRASDGWYEEDSCWALPFWVFQAEILADRGPGKGQEAVESAASTIRHSMPEAWTELTGEKLDASTSAAIDEAEFKKKHENDWTVRSAFGYSEGTYQGVPQGMVGYIAYQTSNVDRYGNPKDARGFLVSREEAKAVVARSHILDLTEAQPVPVKTLGFGSHLSSDYTRLAGRIALPESDKEIEGWVWKPSDEQLQLRMTANGQDMLRTETMDVWKKLLTDPDFENPADAIWYRPAAVALVEGHLPGVDQATVQSTASYLLSRAWHLAPAQAVDDSPSP